ncbi:hypothetical protein J6590_040440 [Homalodisca vitripennis]|nr:hypothetical protein J6590_040440 [Homalodisca vitripennis]
MDRPRLVINNQNTLSLCATVGTKALLLWMLRHHLQRLRHLCRCLRLNRSCSFAIFPSNILYSGVSTCTGTCSVGTSGVKRTTPYKQAALSELESFIFMWPLNTGISGGLD